MEFFFIPLWQGIVAGFLVTVPVGPICLLCIQRSISHGRVAGLASGFGSAIALAIYGIIGFAGVSLLSHAPSSVQIWSTLAGTTILCVLGVNIMRSGPGKNMQERSNDRSALGYAVSTFGLEFINPASIMLFVGIAATMARLSGNALSYLLVGMGIFSVSMLWWLLLINLVASLRRYITPTLLLWLNRAAGTFIILLGLRPLALLL
jgi:threonine/homoserine/homoserine lactone efflux protein